MIVLDELISAVFQIIVFSLIPFIVYLIRKKKLKGFLEYVGLKKSNRKANLLALLISILIGGPIILYSLINPEFKAILTHPESVSGRIHEMGFGLEAVKLQFVDWPYILLPSVLLPFAIFYHVVSIRQHIGGYK